MSSQFNNSSATLEQAYDRSGSPNQNDKTQENQPSTTGDKPGPVAFSSKPPSQISNLTRTLLSSSTTSTTSNTSAHQILPGSLDQGVSADPPSYGSISSSLSRNKSHFEPNSYHTAHNSYHQYNTPQDSINYIPSSHNAPTVVSSSYSSASATPSLHNSSSFIPHSGSFQPVHPHSASFKGHGIYPSAIPTTNVSMANSSSYRDHHSSSYTREQSSSFNSSGMYIPDQHPQFQQSHRFPSSLPGNGFSQQSQPSQPSYNSRMSGQSGELPSSYSSAQTERPSAAPQSSDFSVEPDHYMSYKEFLQNLNLKDGAGSPSNTEGSGYEEHLNIVDYPVNDLIEMLSCLLTKIIEANDKLHPNHFDNTIAIRHKMKEEKRLKKLERLKSKDEKRSRRARSRDEDGDENVDDSYNDYNHSNVIEVDEDEDFDEDDNDNDDDDDDEMKNKYLANVLAFHGTNVPGISLNAYLARVLKYCPVTNEVFLSLLVYFDRIAKKANNLKQKKKESLNLDPKESEGKDSEQLFVMDSYNIHRLIISGITVSSKFFSDIFYKNLRYAKVGGLPLEELNYLELQFLLLLDFKLMISVEDLQNYGDLLLRFWKREQITNELVHNEPN